MRIATFNVNSIHARLAFVLGWLKARAPDVVCMQELKLSDEAFPREAFEAAGYRIATFGQAQWNGVAVAATQEPEVLHRGLLGAEAAGARLLSVRVHDTTVVSVYVPNGKTIAHDDFQLKLRFLDALADYVERELDPRSRVVIGGDFNLCPTDLDSYDPERLKGSIFHTPEERSRFERIVAAGYVDLYRHKNPDGPMFSWWDYRAGCFHKNMGLRIDLLLASASVASATREVFIDRDYRKKKDGNIPSDHAPVIADLEPLGAAV